MRCRDKDATVFRAPSVEPFRHRPACTFVHFPKSYQVGPGRGGRHGEGLVPGATCLLALVHLENQQ